MRDQPRGVRLEPHRRHAERRLGPEAAHAGLAAVRVLPLALLGLYASALLAIGLSRDWRLLHEDNGAMHTTFALSHLTLGLGATRGHDVYYVPVTGQRVPYGHHPAATGLLVAGAFAVVGSDAPWVARLVPIAFHVGTVLLGVALLRAIAAPPAALLGGALLATMPMGAYFGRMVNYEPLCLFGVMLALAGYAAWRGRGARRGLWWCAAGLAAGGLVDWPAFFFAAAIVLAEAWDGWRARPRRLGPAAALAAAASAALAVDVWHLWYAGRGSVGLLAVVDSGGPWRSELARLSPGRFVGHLVETARRYFTDAGLGASALAAAALLAPRARFARRLLDGPGGLARRLLAVSGVPALAYVLAAPPWAVTHPYWLFYALPFVAIATVLAGRALWRWAAVERSAVGALCALALAVDVAVASAVVLWVRHTRESDYAVKQTRVLRTHYLAPRSAGAERPAGVYSR